MAPTCLLHLGALGGTRLCPSPLLSPHPEPRRSGVTWELHVATGNCCSASDSPSQPAEGKSQSRWQRATATRGKQRKKSSGRETWIGASQKQHPSTFHRSQSQHLMISELKISLKKKKKKSPVPADFACVHTDVHLPHGEQVACPPLPPPRNQNGGKHDQDF